MAEEVFDLGVPVPEGRRCGGDAYSRVMSMPFDSSRLFAEKKEASALYCALRYHGFKALMRLRLPQIDNESGWRVWKLKD